MKDDKEKDFSADQDKENNTNQGFDSRNQYSGSGDFSPDEQDPPVNRNSNLDVIIGYDPNNPHELLDSDDNYADQNPSDNESDENEK